MKIDRTKLYNLYMDKVSEISETCDWKSVFGPEEIVNLIAEIIEHNPELVIFDKTIHNNPTEKIHD